MSKLNKRQEAWLSGNVGITIVLLATLGWRYAVVWFFGIGVIGNIVKFIRGNGL